MTTDFQNAYQDQTRAEAYARLEFPGSYYLAYRDIPELIRRQVNGTEALDFGCGAGRSTRFLKKLGLNAMGIDVSEEMVAKAREFDPKGRYLRVTGSDYGALPRHHFDLVLSMFTFDNIPGVENRRATLSGLGELTKESGRIILLDATPEIYWNEWASFSTKDFPENRMVKSGGLVKIIITDVDDKRPVTDTLWFDEDYRDLFNASDLKLVETVRPLGLPTEPYDWVSETTVAPWVIYVLSK